MGTVNYWYRWGHYKYTTKWMRTRRKTKRRITGRENTEKCGVIEPYFAMGGARGAGREKKTKRLLYVGPGFW